MRLPNGYGSVYKLNGNRRKPWTARITVGFNKAGQPKYHFLGYFATRQEALKCLADYNASPYGIENADMTLGEVYQLWRKNKSYQFSEKTLQTYDSRYRMLGQYMSLPMKSIRRGLIQKIIDGEDTAPKRMLTRNFFVNMDRYAVELDIIPHRQTDSLDRIPYTVKTEKQVFTPSEIEMLWNHGTVWSDFTLILLYSGIRISELFQIRCEDCYLGYFKCGVKTQSGKNRIIPIHHAIRDIVARYMETSDEYLAPFSQWQFRRAFKDLMEELGMKHTIHETRHTFRTAFDNTDANRVCINLIMGHSSKDIGERVYTHKTMMELQEAIDLIEY